MTSTPPPPPLGIIWPSCINKNKINNDLEVAHPQSGSSPTWFLVELEFGNVVFGERGKLEYPEKILSEKILSEKRGEPTTNSTHMRRRRWDLNPGQINGRRVLSPLRYPLLPKEGENRLGSVAKLNESISPSNIKFQITPLLALIFLSDVKLVYL